MTYQIMKYGRVCYLGDITSGHCCSAVTDCCSAVTVKFDKVVINERIRVIEELGIYVKQVMSIDFILNDIKVFLQTFS